MQADIAIVIAAYNRPASLQRLLGSVRSANYEGYASIQLLISIDRSGNNECKVVADAFEWKHGNKTVIHHPQNLGLKKHILSCGDYTQQYDAVIVLEDDLFVSAEFYQYAQQAYAFYKHEEKVAGIALYHNTFNEVAYCPFEPVHDGTDVYFMQVPCSWGQLWTKEQWQLFRSYQQKETTTDDSLLPPTVQQWPDASSWKKIFYRYLAKTNRYFIYPRIGLSTNFGDPGQHLTNAQSNFQTPVLLGRKEIHFSSFNAALSIYDGYYEPSGVVYNRRFQKNISVTFDLNGTKSLKNISTEYLLSCKQCKHPEQQFGVACYPYENNVFLSLTAETGESCFSLGKTSMFTDENSFERLSVDFKRVFLTDVFIRQAVRSELEQTKEFRIGKSLLMPFRFIKQLFEKK